jgi:hypothetical protein
MKKAHKIILVTVCLIIGLSLVTLTLPLPKGWDESETVFYISVIETVSFGVLQIGAALLFLQSLGAFTTGLQRAYRKIAIGLVFLGIALLQGALFNVFNLWLHPLVTAGLPGVPFLLSGLVIYLGVRSFARLLDIKSVLMSFIAVIALTGICAIALALLPHQESVLKEIDFDLTNGLLVWVTVSSLVAAGIILKLKGQLSEVYHGALSWFFAGLVLTAMCFAIFITQELVGHHGQSAAYIPLNFLFILNGLIYMKAGYAFTRIEEGHYELPGHAVTSIDVVTYVGGLASNFQAIDPILDVVREISARQQPGESLSPQDEAALEQVYIKLEHYLVTTESLRKFTQQSLRQKVTNKFAHVLGAGSFWEKLSPQEELTPVQRPASAV